MWVRRCWRQKAGIFGLVFSHKMQINLLGVLYGILSSNFTNPNRKNKMTKKSPFDEAHHMLTLLYYCDMSSVLPCNSRCWLAVSCPCLLLSSTVVQACPHCSQLDFFLLHLSFYLLYCLRLFYTFCFLITGSIARSANLPVFNLLRGRFWGFSPRRGDTLHRWGWNCPLLRAKFHPHRCNDKGVGPPKLKFLLRFDRNVEYKRPAGAHTLRDFHKICTVCTSL